MQCIAVMNETHIGRDPGTDKQGEQQPAPRIGVVLRGIDLSVAPEDPLLAVIRVALARHLVVVIEDQDLYAAALRDFVSHFGPVFRHHPDEGVIYAEGVPEVLEMRKEPEEGRMFGGSDWHADVTFKKPAGSVSVLHALIIPPVGGDTCFANTIAAFEALSPALQSVLRGLEAVHNYDGPGDGCREGLTAIYPVVRTHPETVAEGFYINRMFTTRFVDMSEEESRPLIGFLD